MSDKESGYSVCQGGIVKALVHNHPSGNIAPSKQDMDTASKYHVAVCVQVKGQDGQQITKCYRPARKKQMVVTMLKDITPYRRVVENTLPISVQCLKCKSLDTLYAEIRNGKIVSWDYDPNYRVTQRTIYHICGGVCKAFYPGSISQFQLKAINVIKEPFY